MSILQSAKQVVKNKDAALAEVLKKQQERAEKEKAIDGKLLESAFVVFSELAADGFGLTCSNGTIEVRKDNKLLLSARVDRTSGPDSITELRVTDERSIDLGIGNTTNMNMAFRCGFYGTHFDQRAMFFDTYKQDLRNSLVEWFANNRELLL